MGKKGGVGVLTFGLGLRATKNSGGARRVAIELASSPFASSWSGCSTALEPPSNARPLGRADNPLSRAADHWRGAPMAPPPKSACGVDPPWAAAPSPRSRRSLVFAPEACAERTDHPDAPNRRSHTASLKGASAARDAALANTHQTPRLLFFKGNCRMRLPVAAKTAFRTAGPATAIVGSPTPPQKFPDGMRMVSTAGIWSIRMTS